MTTSNEQARILLAETGIALYGPQWISPLARELEINPSSLRDWLNGKNQRFDLTHPVWQRFTNMVDQRLAPLLAVAVQMQKSGFVPNKGENT